MICLTGDVHHSSFRSDDLLYCEGSEIDSAYTMALIAAEFDINLTLFFTGLCVNENPNLLLKISKLKNVEIAGHNYFAFKPRRFFEYYRKISGLKNGPWLFQYWEVRKTINVFEKLINKKIVSWRDHGYRNDRNTINILRLNNIKNFSDTLSKDGLQPQWINYDILDVPINTLPDHDYVFHGSRQPDTIKVDALMKTHFATPPITKEKWLNRIKKEVSKMEKENKISTILAHPACMEVFDDFETFKKLCKFLKQYKTLKMKNISKIVNR